MMLTLIGLGSSCLFMAIIPKNLGGLVLTMYLFGKFCASSVTSICWLYTSELYPTNLRSQAMGTCSMVAR